MSEVPPGGYPPYPERAPVQRVESPVAYHRLYRGVPNYRWWRPLVAVLLLAVFVVVATTIVLIIGIVIGALTGQIRFDSAEAFTTDLYGLVELDAANPLKLAIGLGSVAVMLPLVPLALLCAGLRPVGMLSSIRFRLRWRWLLDCLLPALVVMAVVTVLTFVILPPITGEPLQGVSVDVGTFVVSALVILLLVPFQAAAEEYVFRGILMQSLGAWVRWAPLAIVLPTVLFAFGHIYDVWGLLDVAAFGLAAAWITWRTGGLEAGIVMHTVNNVVLFLLLASGMLGGTVVTPDGGSPIALGITIVTMAAYAYWIDRLATRRGLERRRELAPPAG
jgi:membrane protease YdiL (CAAX protease family)